MKPEIEKILDKWMELICGECPNEEIYAEGMEKIVAAIAELMDEKIDEYIVDRGCDRLLIHLQKEQIVKLKARLAMVESALLGCKAYIQLCCVPSPEVALEDEERLLNEIDKALAAAGGKEVKDGSTEKQH